VLFATKSKQKEILPGCADFSSWLGFEEKSNKVNELKKASDP
jgi:hypothetical protein